MQLPKLSLLAAVAALAITGALVTSRFEADLTATEQAAAVAGSLRAAPAPLGQPTATPDQPPATRTAATRATPPPADTAPPTPPAARPIDAVPTTTTLPPSTASTTSTTGATTVTTTTDTTTTVEAPVPTAPDEETSDVERRGAEALTLISYPWRDRLPGWEVNFHPGTDGAYGYTLTQEQVIDIYVRDGQSIELLAHVIAHELGHAVDVTLNNGDDRRRWQQARDIEEAPWWPNNRASDFATGAGDFAESFAAWQVGTGSYRSQLGDPPTAAQQTLLIELAAD